MPKINTVMSYDVTPEKFLDACKSSELYETWLLINNEYFQQKIAEIEQSDSIDYKVKITRESNENRN